MLERTYPHHSAAARTISLTSNAFLHGWHRVSPGGSCRALPQPAHLISTIRLGASSRRWSIHAAVLSRARSSSASGAIGLGKTNLCELRHNVFAELLSASRVFGPGRPGSSPAAAPAWPPHRPAMLGQGFNLRVRWDFGEHGRQQKLGNPWARSRSRSFLLLKKKNSKLRS